MYLARVLCRVLTADFNLLAWLGGLLHFFSQVLCRSQRSASAGTGGAPTRSAVGLADACRAKGAPRHATAGCDRSRGCERVPLSQPATSALDESIRRRGSQARRRAAAAA